MKKHSASSGELNAFDFPSTITLSLAGYSREYFMSAARRNFLKANCLHQPSTKVWIQMDARAHMDELSFHTGQAQNLHFGLELEKLDQDGSWRSRACVGAKGGRVMGSFNDWHHRNLGLPLGNLRITFVLTQKLRNQLIHEGDHISPFLMFWNTDETQVEYRLLFSASSALSFR